MPCTNYFIYAPFSGTINALETYCATGSDHPDPFLVHPLDVGAGGSVKPIYYVGSSGIDKIIVAQNNNYLCQHASEIPCPWDCGLTISLYVSNVLIGQVYYGHVNNRITAGTKYPALDGNVRKIYIGDTAGSASDCPCENVPNNPDACCCYPSIHSHMECSSQGNYFQLYCGKSVNFKTTQLYQFCV